MNSFRDIYFKKNSQIQPNEVEDDSEVILIWDFNVDKINLSLTASQPVSETSDIWICQAITDHASPQSK